MSRAILKTYFETGEVPIEEEFGTTIDELAHKSDDLATQAQAEDSTDTVIRMFTPERIWQAISKAFTQATLTFQTDTTTARQVSEADTGILTTLDNAALFTLTIPTNAVDPIAIGKRMRYQKIGTGDVLIDKTGVTVDGKLNAASEHRITLAGGYIEVLKTGTDRWSIIGDLDHIKMVNIS